MSKKQLIFWDIDGTLMHCGSDGRKALNRTFTELYGIREAFEHAVIGGAMDYMIIHSIMEAFDIGPKEFDRIANHYKSVLADVLNHNEKKRVLPGVVSLLNFIRKHTGAVNALLTSNLKSGAEVKLNSVGLWSYFKIGGFGDEPGEKWHAAERCIKQAEEQWSALFPRDGIYLIGDSTYDMFCAKKMGIKSVAVATGWGKADDLKACKPDFFFEDLSKTERVLKALSI